MFSSLWIPAFPKGCLAAKTCGNDKFGAGKQFLILYIFTTSKEQAYKNGQTFENFRR